MQGQWIGFPKEKPAADVLVDLEVRGGHYEGTAFLIENDGTPGSLALVRTTNLDTVQHLTGLPVWPISPAGGELTHDQLRQWFPGVEFPSSVDIHLEARPRSLRAKWKSSIGTKGTTSLRPSKASRPSVYSGERGVRTWAQFKKFALQLEPRRFIFRGQCEQQRLRTAFHRTWRKDLVRFMRDDIPALHQALSARTKHVFNLADPLQNGAFWNLVQHHGYPTPLLDWTYSPFVAAFFALRQERTHLEGRKARILAFDKLAWCSDFRQLQHATFVGPHFSILESLAIENERAIPQQSLSSVTNIDDVETYIHRLEQAKGKRYLRAIDLDVSDRASVLSELTQMGITPGSMFPGLDGACEELKNRHFGLS